MPLSNLTFYSDGLRIAGYLGTPDDWRPGDAPRPGILMLSGYGGNPHFDCIHLTRRLCAAGWFLFPFDYRGFGNSEGQRGRHRPARTGAGRLRRPLPYANDRGLDPARLAIYGT